PPVFTILLSDLFGYMVLLYYSIYKVLERTLMPNANSNISPQVLGSTTLIGNRVVNLQGEDLGKVEEIMIDLATGHVGYVVLSFAGILGIGDKLFAVPWTALTVDTVNKRFVMDAHKDLLERAPGFDKNNWPDQSNSTWVHEVYNYYNTEPYWE